MAEIPSAAARRFAEINYGPWDRLEGNAPFIPGVGPKPPGANFYPTDMTKEEFEAAVMASEDGGEQLRSLYTVIRRDINGNLYAQPYPEAYEVLLEVAVRAISGRPPS